MSIDLLTLYEFVADRGKPRRRKPSASLFLIDLGLAVFWQVVRGDDSLAFFLNCRRSERLLKVASDVSKRYDRILAAMLKVADHIAAMQKQSA